MALEWVITIFYGCIIGIGCHLVCLVHLLRHLVFVSFITISLHIDHTLDGLTTVCAHVLFTRNLHFPVSEFHSRITAIFHQNAIAKRQQRWMTNEKKLLPHSTRAPAMLFLPANLTLFWRYLCWWKIRSIFIIWVFKILLRILRTKHSIFLHIFISFRVFKFPPLCHCLSSPASWKPRDKDYLQSNHSGYFSIFSAKNNFNKNNNQHRKTSI